MPYGCWREMVGIIKPTKGSGSPVELIKMLPDRIGVISLFNNVRHGKIEEFRSAIPAYEEKIAELAEDQVDLIHSAARRRSCCSAKKAMRRSSPHGNGSSAFRSLRRERIKWRR
jgi:hypothetical protein